MTQSNLKTLLMSRALIVLLTFNFLWFQCGVSALSTPCISRSFGYDSTVCVCNSTYCDYAPPPLLLVPPSMLPTLPTWADCDLNKVVEP
ncbi:hypothetical protein WDU94_003671 [Cyamophila willieti]